MNQPIEIGIIGGSGLYGMAGLEDVQEHVVETPYGAPSKALVSGRLNGVPVVFLARHGRGRSLIPTEVPYRANIYALRQMGVRYLLSFSAVGSLKEEIAPLEFVLPDQFIDLARWRETTFFGNGMVAHVPMAQPVCGVLCDIVAEAITQVSVTDPVRLHRGGTYVCIEGPQFSSLPESLWYRSMGARVIGMTNMPEAKLAREAQRAQQVAARAIGLIAASRPESDAHSALATGLVTQPAAMSAENRAKLAVFMQRG